jgi:hypothetical protein
MLLRLIKNNRIPGILFIVFLLGIVWLNSFIHPDLVEPTHSMPLYRFIFGSLDGKFPLSVVLGMVFYALIAILILRFNSIHFLLQDRSYMPATFFLFILASYPYTLHLNPILVASPFLVLAMLVLVKGDEHRAEPLALFNATLLLAIGSMFYLKLIFFIPFLWITASVIRPLKWRGIVNPILVVVLMAVFYLTWFWVFKDDVSLFFTMIEENLHISWGTFRSLPLNVWIIIAYISLLIVITSIYLLSRFQGRKIIIRKLYIVLFILFLFCLVFYVFISAYSAEVISLMAIPVAYLFANFFQRRRNHWSHEVLLWIWIALIVYMQVSPYIKI